MMNKKYVQLNMKIKKYKTLKISKILIKVKIIKG